MEAYMELFDLTPLLVFLLGMLFAALSPIASAVRSKIKGKIYDTGLDGYQIELIAEFAVKAAEQSYKYFDGEIKLAKALEIMEMELARRHIKIDIDLITAYIEKAVYDMRAQ